ncbi:MAG: SgcJ/EcaC family oxidoreductase [Gemmatimonadetes bacterium]|nr:nuclear transport factor 2 family protein [Gemmatimonadota bacterium]NIR81567.1 nuclear transport factor 2 family protein [Gemmatimonadota bacterium]NIT90408.1 nuclear transport factor 2 family protein [Gemmatimonadota bacterium]NIU34242.1 nuclear transport factor 2 family protein [Gemmatimonadota bacterium]NIU38370.1 SgcJ/EcaC family oxidoreductase [Gemmatimonadota bacterium]
MLQASASSWNAGDLDGFLDDYADDPGLTFVGGGSVIRGRAEVRRRYLETYWASGSRRDSLRFRDLEIRALGSRHALALGRYELYRPDGEIEVTGSGRFSLVLRIEDGRWSIVHDHSSSDGGQGEG